MSVAILRKGKRKMERKSIHISSKRQITIPQKFYQALGFENEAECVMRGEELVIRPVRTEAKGDFSEQILEELIAQGLSGKALLKEFKNKQAQVRPAVEKMLSDAKAVADGSGAFVTYDEVFGAEE